MDAIALTDRTLVCRECAKPFVFSAGEQQFFIAKGLTNAPGRCLDCRAAYQVRTSTTRLKIPRTLFAAICSKCGGQALLPFEPCNERPVYCSGCFDAVRPPKIPKESQV